MDFKMVMLEWRRMCDTFTTDEDETCCENCPLRDFDEYGCDAIFSDFAKNADWAEVERVVMQWANDNPAPIYPKWYEWLKKQGLIHMGEQSGAAFVTSKITEPIPADIAEKLGIEPVR